MKKAGEVKTSSTRTYHIAEAVAEGYCTKMRCSTFLRSCF